jgi:acetyltransferase-like isoleucine patch superfamily enzyme
MMMRSEFYRRTLRSCGENVQFGFGTILNYSDISIGNHVSFGRYNNLGLVDFGDHVLVASQCSFLSGRHTHNFSDGEKPIHMQETNRIRITVGRDVWVGRGVIVMSSVGDGVVIGAGSVVTKPVEGHTVVAGNPARELRKRVL